MNSGILNWIERDKSELVNFCAALVRCNTSCSHGDTRSAMELIKNYFAAEGIDFQELAACKTMPNLPAGDASAWSVKPWSGTIKNGNRLKDNLRGRLTLTLVSDEESGWGRGTGFLFDKVPDMMTADGVLSGEPSGVDAISFSSKGCVQIAVKVRTRGAIAGYSNESKNAVELAANLIRDLKGLEDFPVTLPDELRSFMDADGYKAAHERIRGAGHFEQPARVTVDICTIKGVGTDVEGLLDELRRIVANYPEAALRIDGVDLPDISPADGDLAQILSDTVVELGKARPLLTPDIALSDCRYWRYRGTPALRYL